MIVHWPAGIDAAQRGHEARPVRQRRRHRPDDLRAARRHAARRRTAASSSCRSPGTPSPTSSPIPTRRPPTRCSTSRWAAAERSSPDDLEGGVQAHAGRRLRHRAVGALPTSPIDPSECHDLADDRARAAGRARSSCGGSEAERHGVLPLDDRMIELFGARFRDHSPHPADRRYVYRPPMSPMPGQASAAIGGRSFDLTARVTRDAGRRGRAVRHRHGELGHLGVRAGRPARRRLQRVRRPHDPRVRHPRARRATSTLAARFRRGERAWPAAIELAVDGVDAGRADLPLFMRMISSVGPSLGVRPRVGGVDPLRRAVPVRRHAPRGRDPTRLTERRPARADAEARAEMSRQ